jgi:hypothetical protein
MLPNFLLIGAEKAGTTSIHNYLRAHPDVFMARVKEPLFFAFEGRTVAFKGPGDEEFNRRIITAPEAYQALFAGAERYRAVGESSATYLYYSQSPERAAQYVPNAKLIVVLRNPADRAYSNFLHGIRAGKEHLDFGAALKAEPERMASGWSPFFSYRAKGWYHAQLGNWMNYFPPDRFLFFLYDDLRARPLEVMRRIFEFIGVNPDFRPDVEVQYNVSGKPLSPWFHELIKGNTTVHALARSVLPAKLRARLKADITRWNLARPSLAPHLRAGLLAQYAPDLAKLGPMIGRDLSDWAAPSRSAAVPSLEDA